MREIDWKRGSPYVWRGSDYEYLKNSKMLFARKFDENVDELIIDQVLSLAKNEEH